MGISSERLDKPLDCDADLIVFKKKNQEGWVQESNIIALFRTWSILIPRAPISEELSCFSMLACSSISWRQYWEVDPPNRGSGFLSIDGWTIYPSFMLPEVRNLTGIFARPPFFVIVNNVFIARKDYTYYLYVALLCSYVIRITNCISSISHHWTKYPRPRI